MKLLALLTDQWMAAAVKWASLRVTALAQVHYPFSQSLPHWTHSGYLSNLQKHWACENI